MRALQLKSIFTAPKTAAKLEEIKKIERERIANARPYVDTKAPISMNQMKDAAKSPSKRLFRQQGVFSPAASLILFLLLYMYS